LKGGVEYAMTRSTARNLNLTRRCKKGLSNSIAVLHPFKAQWLLYALQGLTLKNYTFCPHSVFMCSVRISEKNSDYFPYTALTDWFL